MKIEVLGTGCAKCGKLYEAAREAVRQSGVEAEVVKVEDLTRIMKYRVMATPALVVDGQVRFAGRVAAVAEILELLRQAG